MIVDWPFPSKYSEKLALSLRGYEFIFPNLENSLKTFMEPSPTLINSKPGQEEISTVLTRDIFSLEYKGIEDNIKSYKNASTTHYINESYFLYNKSSLIKDAFISALNKKILIYGSILIYSYFNKKAENKIFKIVSPEEFLEFYVDKDVTRNSISFQLRNKSGDIPKPKDIKIYKFSLTRIGEKRKRKMAETIETVIVCTQQNFEITGELNPVQIEIEDYREF